MEKQNPEKALIGCFLQDDSILTDIALLNAGNISDPLNRKIVEEAVTLYENKTDVDTLTLTGSYERKYDEDISSYLTECIMEVPTATHYQSYISEIKEIAKARRLETIIATAPGKGIDWLKDRVDDLYNDVTETDFVNVEQGLARLKKVISDRKESGIVPGIKTGYSGIDQKVTLHKGNLIVLAARPSVGKSAFALNIAGNVAKNKKRVTFFSLEMETDEVMERLLAMVSGVPSYPLKNGTLTPEQWTKINNASKTINELDIYIDDGSSCSPRQVVSKVKKLSNEKKVNLVIIDYLQIMDGDHREKTEYERISNITRSLKKAANELGVPVLLLAQLNREIEKRTNKRPVLSDLRGSGTIEQDANVVMFMHTDDEFTTKQGVSIIIAKHRAGETGEVKLNFNKEILLFENEVTTFESLRENMGAKEVTSNYFYND